jgi:hypothetical protein
MSVEYKLNYKTCIFSHQKKKTTGQKYTGARVWLEASSFFVWFHGDGFFANDYIGFLFFPFEVNDERD